MKSSIDKTSQLLFRVSSILFGFLLGVVLINIGPTNLEWIVITPLKANIKGLCCMAIFIVPSIIFYLWYWWSNRIHSIRSSLLQHGFFSYLFVAFCDIVVATPIYFGYHFGYRLWVWLMQN